VGCVIATKRNGKLISERNAMSIPLELLTCLSWAIVWAIFLLWGFDAVMSERHQ